jgi:hypothetical protein
LRLFFITIFDQIQVSFQKIINVCKNIKKINSKEKYQNFVIFLKKLHDVSGKTLFFMVKLKIKIIFVEKFFWSKIRYYGIQCKEQSTFKTNRHSIFKHYGPK